MHFMLVHPQFNLQQAAWRPALISPPDNPWVYKALNRSGAAKVRRAEEKPVNFTRRRERK